MLVDVRKHSKYPLSVPENQEPKESRKLWEKVTEGITKNDQDLATDEKSKVEDEERALRKERETKKIKWEYRFFNENNDVYTFKGMEK